MPCALASSMIRAATSRTCPTEPGAPESSAERSVCTESITHACGACAASVSSTVSRSVSASIGTSSAPPGREALGAQPDLLGGLLAADVQRAVARPAAGDRAPCS